MDGLIFLVALFITALVFAVLVHIMDEDSTITLITIGECDENIRAEHSNVQLLSDSEWYSDEKYKGWTVGDLER